MAEQKFAFSFVSLSHFKRNQICQFIDYFSRKGWNFFNKNYKFPIFNKFHKFEKQRFLGSSLGPEQARPVGRVCWVLHFPNRFALDGCLAPDGSWLAETENNASVGAASDRLDDSEKSQKPDASFNSANSEMSHFFKLAKKRLKRIKKTRNQRKTILP
jgi:hypothetical protein